MFYSYLLTIHKRLYFILKFCSLTLLIDKSILFYRLCEVKCSAEKRFTVLQLLKIEKHIRSVNQIDEPKISRNLLEFNVPIKGIILTKIYVSLYYLFFL